MLRAKSWADGVPKVRVASIELGNACVDVVLIDHDSESLPYYLTADYGNGRAVSFAPVPFIRGMLTAIPQKRRRLTRSRPSDSGVDILAWTRRRSRGSLSCSPSLPSGFIPSHLARDEEIQRVPSITTPTFPEFTFVRKPEEDWTGVEYFMLASPFFSHPNWWTGYFYYHQTLIRKMPGAYSDHLWIPAPRISALSRFCCADSSEAAHFYAYYLQGSIERIAMMFELDESKRRSQRS